MLGPSDFNTIAARDFDICVMLEPFFSNESALADAAYHIQQAIEKVLKALTLLAGEVPEFTHNIAKLAAKCTKLGIEMPAQLELISDALTLWESTSRYDPEFIFSIKLYEEAKSVYQLLKADLDQKLEAIQKNEQKHGPSLTL